METNEIAGTALQTGKLLVKGLLIGLMILLLLIPAFFVQNLVQEREQRQKDAFTEVSSKWAGKQNITGPVLVIPYMDGTTKRFSYFLPDKLLIDSKVNPEKRSRGIFKVMLYNTDIKLSGSFSSIPLQAIKLNPENMVWNEAYVCLSVADVRGLNTDVKLNWNDSLFQLAPGTVDNAVMNEGFMAPLNLSAADIDKPVKFSAEVSLNGSEQLLFTPVGKETTVSMNSAWPDPKFNGSQLPVRSDISDTGFTASWKSLAHTRHFPQQWKDDKYNLSESAFGTDLYIPVNGYQKIERSVKYAILCILLTFAAFFIIELINKKYVHPLQYGLIGLALILFYTLLLSFYEYIGFNAAYVVASVATVGLIAWFVKGILESTRLSSVLSVVLLLLYSYIFTILQLQDYSLLLGSVGLFLTLGVIMNYTRKLKW
ncbi:MAG: cell envelope integrity protein CreD [Bacteroidetes bacterium]|nr:cell envelope integrity protein CreD [Bacteroidota bacterium]